MFETSHEFHALVITALRVNKHNEWTPVMVYSFPYARPNMFRPFDGGGGNDGQTVQSETATLLELQFTASTMNLRIEITQERFSSLYLQIYSSEQCYVIRSGF